MEFPPKYLTGKKGKNLYFTTFKDQAHKFIRIEPGLSGEPGTVTFKSANANKYLKVSPSRPFMDKKVNNKNGKQATSLFITNNLFHEVRNESK